MNWHPLQAFLHRNWSCLWSCPLPGWSFSLHTLGGRCSSLSYPEKVHNQLSGQCMTKCGKLWPSGTPSWLRSAELGMFPCDFLVERNFREGQCLWGSGECPLFLSVQAHETVERAATADVYICPQKRHFNSMITHSGVKEKGKVSSSP